jgi:hypothetical protein
MILGGSLAAGVQVRTPDLAFEFTPAFDQIAGSVPAINQPEGRVIIRANGQGSGREKTAIRPGELA